MVKDKINYRGTGPRTKLTKQTVGGRANDGGLRVGEMERDTIISHGISDFLRESMMERGDKYYIAICNHSGLISIYNPSKKLFISPIVDGPLKYVGSFENEDLSLEHITKFGRSFSIVCVPYTFKLLVQELQAMNVQMRIITEDNIDQIENMSYSDNIAQLTGKNNTADLLQSIREIMNRKQNERIITPDDNEYTPDSSIYQPVSPEYAPTRTRDEYDPNSPPYSAILGRVMTREEFNAQNNPSSPEYKPTSPIYAPVSPDYPPESPPYLPESSEYNSFDSKTDKESSSPDYFSGTPPYNPMSPPLPPDDSQQGGGPRYNIGERVCMRNCKDNYPTRPWTVSHVGPKFITISAIDRNGLEDNETMNVVTPFDIYPEEEAHIQHPPTLTENRPTLPHVGIPIEQQPQQIQPSIVIAPKFFNGNGSDHSSEAKQSPDSVPMEYFLNNVEQPSIVVKDDVKETPSITPNKKTDDIDFSNIVIRKAGS